MPTLFRPFFLGFTLTLFLFLTVNVISAHLRSDCGLPAFFNLAGCADDIRRSGFPLQFFEEGGFSYRSNFDPLAFGLAMASGMMLSVVCGLVTSRVSK